jgi:hypothetical protein
MQHSRRASLASVVASIMALAHINVRERFGDVAPPHDWLPVARDEMPSPALWRVTLQHAVKRPHTLWAGVVVDTVFGPGVVLAVVDEPSLPLRVSVLLWFRETRTLDVSEVRRSPCVLCVKLKVFLVLACWCCCCCWCEVLLLLLLLLLL